MTATSLGPPRTASRVWWYRHPEAPLLALVATCWIALGASHWAAHGQIETPAWYFDLLSWSMMVIAMMVPATLPMQRRVAFSSLAPRRQRAGSLFVFAYVGVWAAFGLLGLGLVRGYEAVTGRVFAPEPAAISLTLLAAAGWQLTDSKARALRRCHLRRRLAPRGWAADRSVIAYGFVHARACATSCGPLMAAMFVGAHDFHLMAPLAAVTTFERMQRRPNPTAGAAAIVAVAALAAITG